MQTYRIETRISKEGSIYIKGLPFSKGEKVEILVRKREKNKGQNNYPLRGKPIDYKKPFDSVAESDWDVVK